MSTDSQTNFLFLADTLAKRYSRFYLNLRKLLDDQDVQYGLLPRTKDVWAVDYMPIQIDGGEFVQFTYNPDYLRNSVKWRRTISDVDAICLSLGIRTKKCEILFDGGNLIRLNGKAIVCDKVFVENQTVGRKDLTTKLMDALEIDNLTIIPTDPNDFTGHADGIVRFYDENTLLINKYGMQDRRYQIELENVLIRAGFTLIPVSYNPYNNASVHEARGTYLNFLQMDGLLIIPSFNIPEDEEVLRLFEQLYRNESLTTIDSNEIAKDGGILNCISWNIKTTDTDLQY